MRMGYAVYMAIWNWLRRLVRIRGRSVGGYNAAIEDLQIRVASLEQRFTVKLRKAEEAAARDAEVVAEVAEVMHPGEDKAPAPSTPVSLISAYHRG